MITVFIEQNSMGYIIADCTMTKTFSQDCAHFQKNSKHEIASYPQGSGLTLFRFYELTNFEMMKLKLIQCHETRMSQSSLNGVTREITSN